MAPLGSIRVSSPLMTPSGDEALARGTINENYYCVFNIWNSPSRTI